MGNSRRVNGSDRGYQPDRVAAESAQGVLLSPTVARSMIHTGSVWFFRTDPVWIMEATGYTSRVRCSRPAGP
jgi:hypothetical protein